MWNEFCISREGGTAYNMGHLVHFSTQNEMRTKVEKTEKTEGENVK
jgi:hypothetical protein